MKTIMNRPNSLIPSVEQLFGKGDYRAALRLLAGTSNTKSLFENDESTTPVEELYWRSRVLRKLEYFSEAEQACLQALQGQPEDEVTTGLLHAECLAELGHVYRSTGQFAQSEQLYRQALSAIPQGTQGKVLRAQTRNALGNVREIQGDYKEAASLLESAYQIRTQQFGNRHLECAESLDDLSVFHSRTGRIVTAVKMARAAVEIRREIQGEQHPDFAWSAQCLANTVQLLGNITETENLTRSALEIREKTLGENHSATANSLDALARILCDKGQIEEAENLARRALEITKEAFGEDHHFVAGQLANLAFVCETNGDSDEAETLYRQSLEVIRGSVGEHNLDYIWALTDLVYFYSNKGDFTEAEKYLREAQEQRPVVIEGGVPMAQTNVLAAESWYCSAQGQFADAEKADRQVITLLEPFVDDCPDQIVSATFSLARSLNHQGQLQQAEDSFSQALTLCEKSLGKEHPSRLDCMYGLLGVAQTQQDWATAEKWARKADELTRTNRPDDPLVRVNGLHQVAGTIASQGDTARAEAMHLQAIEIVRQHFEDESKEHAQSLTRLGGFYQAALNYQAAEVRFKQALEIQKILVGEKHADYARCLNNLATLYRAGGNLQAAGSLYEKVLQVRREVHGDEHFETVQTMSQLAEVYELVGNFPKAEQLYQEALEVLRKDGEDHPEYAPTLHGLAMLRQSQGDFEEAEKLLRQVLTLMEKQVYSPNDPALVPVLGSLVELYFVVGDYLQAEPLMSQIVEINRIGKGEQTWQHAADLAWLSRIHASLGEYESAEAMTEKGLQIVRQTGGQDHPQVVTRLSQLAGLYLAHQRPAKAEKLYRESLRILRAAFGQYHPDVAGILGGLAQAYSAQGQFNKADELCRESLDIWEKLYGINNLQQLGSQRWLASLCMSQGRYGEAKLIYQKTLELLRRAVGDQHPLVAQEMMFLANLAWKQGNLDEAESVYRQALRKTQTSSIPADGVDVEVCTALGRLLVQKGHYSGAERLLRQTLADDRENIGENNLPFLSNVTDVVRVCLATGREAEGLALLEEQVAHEEAFIPAYVAGRSEWVRGFFGGQLRGSYEVRLDLVSSHFRHSPEQIRALYTQVLRRKGHWMEMLGASQTSQLGTRYPHLKDKLARMLQLGRQISGKAFTGPGLEGLKMYQRFLSAWQQEREQLEEELAHDIPEIATERKLRKVQTEDLVQTLPQDSVLVEIVHYRRAGVNPTAHYAAFVIDAEKSDPATLIDLGAADEIDKLVAAYRTALTSTQRSAKTVEVIRKAGEKLRRAVWDTIAPGVKDARRVVLALEGELSHVPFETLPTAGDEYLIDRFQFQYVTSGRDLLRDEPSLTNPGKPIVIERDEEHLGGPQQSLWRRFLNWLGILDDQQSQPEDLQSDRRSVAEQVAELLQGEHWKDQGASKTRLSKVESPKWLHLAVPCVFQGNGLNALKRTKPTSSDNSPPPTMKNLMSSSGVVLAGTGVDGRSIVTYQDIESLDLRQTDLTVLPCCDTSSKDTCSGDHVLALQNAFRQAGTKALVMTLWQVSDSTAEAIALSLYRDVLNGRPPAQALREAQLASKALGIDVRDWGAWICQVGNGAV